MTETAKASPTAPAGESAATRLWLIVGVLALGTFATGTDSFVTVGILPRISTDLHVSIGRGGQLVTLFAWAYAIGSPILMTATARFARKSLLSVAILAFGLVNLSVVFIHSFAALAITRVIAAAFAAIYVPCAAVAAAMIAPAEKRAARWRSSSAAPRCPRCSACPPGSGSPTASTAGTRRSSSWRS